MIKATVLQVFRKTNNVIYGYKIQDITGIVKDLTPEQLKSAIKNKSIQLDNYKLTEDNRLIEAKNSFQPIDSYLLMNKNSIIAEFELYTGTVKVYGKMPYDFSNIQQWIEVRTKFSCAHNVKDFFKTIGLESAEDIIDVIHCVSLHDTFWIKRKSSRLSWENVSPFQHSYSKVISTYALEGIIPGKDKNYFSPDVSDNGSFPHTWKFSKNNITFIKAGSKYTLGGSNSGREPFSEYYASIVSQYLGFHNVKYTIRNHTRHDNKIDVVTECKCFTSEETGTVTAYLLKLDSYEKVIEYCKNLSKKAYDTVLDMLFLDCLLLNTDRHFRNIEFFVDNNTLEVKDITPIFDNNYSFLPRFIEGYDTFDRSEYTARDNRTFEDLYKLISQHKSFRKELIILKKLKLEKPVNVDMTDKRINFLNWFLQMQVDYLLK